MFALQINFSGVFEKVAVRESSKKYSIFPKCDLVFFEMLVFYWISRLWLGESEEA